MIDTIYLEEGLESDSRARDICSRFPKAVRIPIARYGEVFNRKAQSFRLQKRRPALILARKRDHFVSETPKGYGIGARRNYYFSTMLNCPYDCRYCFLQGMYRSAHYVIFVNYEDFQAAIESRIRETPGEEIHFFSGYDCDSLAFEAVTRSAAHFLPFFARHPRALLELRTKSVRIQELLEREPLSNCVVAASFTPPAVADALENGAPPVPLRIEALRNLAEAGWRIGLRFDPLILTEGYREEYRGLFAEVFSRLRRDRIHSVSLGAFRLPRAYFQNLLRWYPDEKLFAGPLDENGGLVSYRRDLEEELREVCARELLRYIPQEIFFPCRNEIG